MQAQLGLRGPRGDAMICACPLEALFQSSPGWLAGIWSAGVAWAPCLAVLLSREQQSRLLKLQKNRQFLIRLGVPR